MMTKKKFDCVEMKQKGSVDVLKSTQNLTREEELKYWQNGTNELKQLKNEKSGKLKISSNK